MKNRFLPVLVALLAMTWIFPTGHAANDPLDDLALKLTQEIERGQAYSDLKELVAIGPRLTASTGAEKAVAWAKAKMITNGFSNVRLQPVTVPHWERGTVEKAELNTGDSLISLKVTALGGSVGTGPAGVQGDVVEVHSLDEVDRLGAQVKGKIVFYNRPMDPTEESFDAYDDAVDQRYDGASRAAKYGAVGILIRSLTTLTDDDHPHTGIMSYRKDVPKIPAGALSTHAAGLLSRYAKIGSFPLRLTLSAQSLGTSVSYNVIGELPGAEKPDEYVVIGGHLDAWDLGVGAQDDGTGVVSSIEVLRAMKALAIQPKRTIRVVLFMAEEFGGIGAREYARQAQLRGEKHVVALESDRGAFAPIGFERDPESFGGATVLETVAGWAKYLAPLHADSAKDGFSGTDVEPLNGVSATFGYVPESKHYFDYHHSALDQLDAVDPGALNQGASAMAIFAYLASEKRTVKPIPLSALLVLVALAPLALAKRAAPPVIAPITVSGAEGNSQIAFEVTRNTCKDGKSVCGLEVFLVSSAKDAQTGATQTRWKTELYKQIFQKNLETDVQEILPLSLSFVKTDQTRLVAKDERNNSYFVRLNDGKLLTPSHFATYPDR